MTKPLEEKLRHFQDFTLEELMDSTEFIKYLKESSLEHETADLEKLDQQFVRNIYRAREIIQILKDGGDDLTESEVRLIWQKIESSQEIQLSGNRQSWRTFLGYAAVVILLLSLGTLLFRQFSPTDDIYRFSAVLPSDSIQDTRIILQSGEEFASSEKVSSIKVNSEGSIEIDQTQKVQVESVKEAKKIAMNEVVVPYGRKSQLTLSDGTKVWLNAGSRLAFPASFSDDNREVWLEGEAYFEVAKDPAKKFFVRINDLSLQVLGTSFNVSAYGPDKTVETVLVTGSLSLSAKSNSLFGAEEVILNPRQKATYSREVKDIEVKEVKDVEIYTAWTSGWLSFSQHSLKDVAVRMERYYNVKFVFEDGFNSDHLISGKLDLKDSIDTVLDVLSDIVNFQYAITDKQVVVSQK